MEQFKGTTIVSVRRNGMVAIGGDGQVTLGTTVMKANARKVRLLAEGRVIAGFAGGTADAFTLFELFEAKLTQYGQATSIAANSGPAMVPSRMATNVPVSINALPPTSSVGARICGRMPYLTGPNMVA
mgnify:CR=1 FL=1